MVSASAVDMHSPLVSIRALVSLSTLSHPGIPLESVASPVSSLSSVSS